MYLVTKHNLLYFFVKREFRLSGLSICKKIYVTSVLLQRKSHKNSTHIKSPLDFVCNKNQLFDFMVSKKLIRIQIKVAVLLVDIYVVSNIAA